MAERTEMKQDFLKGLTLERIEYLPTRLKFDVVELEKEVEIKQKNRIGQIQKMIAEDFTFVNFHDIPSNCIFATYRKSHINKEPQKVKTFGNWSVWWRWGRPKFDFECKEGVLGIRLYALGFRIGWPSFKNPVFAFCFFFGFREIQFLYKFEEQNNG